MHLPKWMANTPPGHEDFPSNIITYYLRQAAVFHNQHGSLVVMAEAAGYQGDYLRKCILRGKVPRKAAIALEAVVGCSEIFSAEVLAGLY